MQTIRLSYFVEVFQVFSSVYNQDFARYLRHTHKRGQNVNGSETDETFSSK